MTGTHTTTANLPDHFWDAFGGDADRRLEQQIGFVLEMDRLKQVLRQTTLLDRTRKENDAEHSWHLGLMAVVLAEYAIEPIDLARVLKMVLIHDIVEIDAGDTFCYDVAAHADKLEREQRAADRLFGLLPAGQAEEFRALWDEFERRETADARFANALDRLQPMLLNYFTGGGTWREHSISGSRVRERNAPIGDGAPELWKLGAKLIDTAVTDGVLSV